MVKKRLVDIMFFLIAYMIFYSFPVTMLLDENNFVIYKNNSILLLLVIFPLGSIIFTSLSKIFSINILYTIVLIMGFVIIVLNQYYNNSANIYVLIYLVLIIVVRFGNDFIRKIKNKLRKRNL